LLAVLVAGACSVVLRYRRGGELIRRQIRWFAFSVLLVPGALLACIVSYAIFGGVSPLGIAALGLLFVALPCAVVVAILRHDLYDIDRLISRTLAYTTVSALLAGLFVVTAFAAGTVLGQGSAPAAAVAGVLCTVSFSPLRRRVQAVVDRGFYRDRRVAMATVRRFVDEVRDGQVQPDGVEPTLQRALADPALRLYYRLPAEDAEDAEGRWVDAQGRPMTVAPEAGIPVTASGHLLAVVLSGAGGQGRAALVREVVREARLPIELSRLQAQLRQALAETAASRARLVRAADDERRRLQRDLHDGAQQRLVALGLELRHTQHALPPDGPGRHTLDRAVEQLQDAVGELRRIAHGLRPSALDDGLPAALRSLVRSSPVRVELDLDDVTLPEPVTTAAYYVAAEAVANALKHANADSIRIALRHTDGSVTLAVLDDGIGGAVPQDGSGLTGIADRVATLGGTLRLHSPPGAGTRIEVVLPCVW
jgi:signal transduction histidine kinase